MTALHIHTLGPTGTSSEQAAEYLCSILGGHTAEISLHDTFEDAANLVIKSGDNNSVFIVANAYHNISKFYMDGRISIAASFIKQTPLYGIAIREISDIDSLLSKSHQIKIITHPAPIPLYSRLADSVFNKYEVVFDHARSTAHAASLVAANEYDFCITNQSSATAHGLRFVGHQHPITMLWSIFCTDANTDRIRNFLEPVLPPPTYIAKERPFRGQIAK